MASNASATKSEHNQVEDDTGGDSGGLWILGAMIFTFVSIFRTLQRKTVTALLVIWAPVYTTVAIIWQHRNIFQSHPIAKSSTLTSMLDNLHSLPESLLLQQEDGFSPSSPTMAEVMLFDVEKLVNRSTLDIPLELYQNETSPVQDLLKVYVYDTLPPEKSTTLEQFVTETGYTYNWVTDLVLVRLFQSFPGRTYDPHEADIFVVPYLHVADCMKANYSFKCRSLDPKNTSAVIKQHLEYYNKTTENRHLFFLSDSEFLVHSWIVNQPLLAMYGPRWEHKGSSRRQRDGKRSPPGHILIPPFNNRPDFQPSVVLARQKEHDQNRNLSLAFVAHSLNKKMGGGGLKSPRILRRFLIEQLHKKDNDDSKHNDAKANNNNLIAGLPFVASEDMKRYSNHAGGIYGLYRRSIFCPVIAGDIAWQRRFFDVMACGCIPVVMSYPLSSVFLNNETRKSMGNGNLKGLDTAWASKVSWFVPEHAFEIGDTWSTKESYPFIEQVDYRSFVVECPGNLSNHQDTSSVVPILESLLLKEQNKLQKKQEALRQYSLSFLYGVGSDAHRYDDAFAHLIRSLRSYVDGLPLIEDK